MLNGFTSWNVFSFPMSCAVRTQGEGTLTVIFQTRFKPVVLYSCSDEFECEWAMIEGPPSRTVGISLRLRG
jgi:hypothetical protein